MFRKKRFYIAIIVICLIGSLTLNLVRSNNVKSEYREIFTEIYEDARSMNARELRDRLNEPNFSAKLVELRDLLDNSGHRLSTSDYEEYELNLIAFETLRDNEKAWGDMTVEERLECEKLLARISVDYITGL